MCGILGFATSNPSPNNAKYLKKLLYLSAIRGTDATGIAYVKDGKVIIEKDKIDANEFIKTLLPKHEAELAGAHIALGHTRTPTIGTPNDNNNNHPLESDRWILIHNGSVSSMVRLKDYAYKGEVDSEVLLSYVQTYGLEKGLPYVGRTGTAAVALIDKEEPNAIYLWRETNPIRIAYDEQSETIFFASQEDFLAKSLTNKLNFFSTFQMRELPENLLVKITVNPIDITPINYVEVNTVVNKPSKAISAVVYSATSAISSPYANGYSNYNSASKSGLGLIMNPVTLRWEKGVEKIACCLKSEDPHIYGLLIELGYSEQQINLMSSETASTIIYNNIKSIHVNILANGALQFMSSQTLGQENLKNRYYIRDLSRDFKGWHKLTAPNRGYISLDGELIKKWDKELKQHFIMLIGDAITEKLVDDVSLQADLDEAWCLDLQDENNNVPKELMS